MRVTYNGYPLHYDPRHGWGYLVPDKVKAATDRETLLTSSVDDEEAEKNLGYPIRWGEIKVKFMYSLSLAGIPYARLIESSTSVGPRLRKLSPGWYDVTNNSRVVSRDWDVTSYHPQMRFVCLDSTLGLDYFSGTSFRYAFQKEICRACSWKLSDVAEMLHIAFWRHN